MACPLSIVSTAATLSGFCDALDIGRAQGELDLIRMRIEQGLHGVAKLERPPHGFRTLVVRRDVERKEGRPHSSFPKPGQIDMPLAGRPGKILLAVQHPLNGIDVTVDADRLGVDATCPLEGALAP